MSSYISDSEDTESEDERMAKKGKMSKYFSIAID